MTVKDNEKDILTLKELTRKLSAILVGNGERGMDEVVRDIEKRVGVLESEFSHFKRVYFEREGLDALGNKKEKDPEEKETKTFLEKLWDRIKNRFLDATILAVIIVLLSDLPKIIEKVIDLLQ